MVRTTQDDERENMQVKLFDLAPLQGRSNKYIPDAILAEGDIEHFIELKTCDARRKQVSTARNVTLNKIKEWEKVWWVFSSYQKDSKGNVSLLGTSICFRNGLISRELRLLGVQRPMEG